MYSASAQVVSLPVPEPGRLRAAAGPPRTGQCRPPPRRSGSRRAPASGSRPASRTAPAPAAAARCPSAPTTSAVGSVKSISIVARSARRPPARPSRRRPPSTPRARGRCSRRPRSCTCDTAPADAFAAAPPSGAAWRVCRTTPSAPAASTVRRIAPTLCGSSMPSSTTISGAPVGPRDADPRRSSDSPILHVGDDALVHAAARRAIELAGVHARAPARRLLRRVDDRVHASVAARSTRGSRRRGPPAAPRGPG